MILLPPSSTLFPYTTLFRSQIPDLLFVFGKRCPQRYVHVPALLDRGGECCLHAPIKQSRDRKSTRLNSSHLGISYAVFCLKKKKDDKRQNTTQTDLKQQRNK